MGKAKELLEDLNKFIEEEYDTNEYRQLYSVELSLEDWAFIWKCLVLYQDEVISQQRKSRLDELTSKLMSNFPLDSLYKASKSL